MREMQKYKDSTGNQTYNSDNKVVILSKVVILHSSFCDVSRQIGRDLDLDLDSFIKRAKRASSEWRSGR